MLWLHYVINWSQTEFQKIILCRSFDKWFIFLCSSLGLRLCRHVKVFRADWSNLATSESSLLWCRTFSRGVSKWTVRDVRLTKRCSGHSCIFESSISFHKPMYWYSLSVYTMHRHREVILKLRRPLHRKCWKLYKWSDCRETWFQYVNIKKCILIWIFPFSLFFSWQIS